MTAKRPRVLPFRLGVLQSFFGQWVKKRPIENWKKNIVLAIDLLWAMSSKGLTANFNPSRYRSFEWFISHIKRPVVLSVVRAVAQFTRVCRKPIIKIVSRIGSSTGISALPSMGSTLKGTISIMMDKLVFLILKIKS